MRPRILCIGGLDPSGAAGLLADAEAVRAAGGEPWAIATALTIQTPRGRIPPQARIFQSVPTRLVLAQLAALFEESPPDAIKLGMLGTARLGSTLTAWLGPRLGRRPLVVDPVLRASNGLPLLRGGIQFYGSLWPLTSVVTPNLPEIASLLEIPEPKDRAEMQRAGVALLGRGARAVLLKGGHLPGPTAPDLFVDRAGSRWRSAPRLAKEARGTGCRFAAALATRLAMGQEPYAAAGFAKRLVRAHLRRAP